MKRLTPQRPFAWRPVLLAGVLGALAACGTQDPLFTAPPSAEAVEYDIEIIGAPTDEVTDLAEDALTLYIRQDEGAASLAFLQRRAEGDREVMQTILKSFGYYEAEVEVEAEQPDPEQDEAIARVIVTAGPIYTLKTHEFLVENADPQPGTFDAVRLGSPVGQAADAEAILASEDAAVAQLQRSGYAYATFVDREAVADPEAKTIEVVTIVNAGNAYRFGDISFEGVTRVPEDYLASYQTWKPGQTFNAAEVAAFQRDLTQTELFNAISVEIPEDPPEGNRLPVTVRAEERRPRSFSVGVSWNTDLGPQLDTSVQHRNLLGRNERGSVALKVNRAEQAITFAFRKPQFRRDGQDLISSVKFTNFSDETLEGEVVEVRLGGERQLDDRWRVGLGGALELSDLEDDGEFEQSALAGLPFFGQYDSTRDRLDPQNGNRFRLDVVPYIGTVDTRDVTFTRVNGRISFYRRLDDDAKYVLATRFRAGTIIADQLDDVPTNQRLYSGGGGSVRGFELDGIGPRGRGNEASGGLSAAEAGVELRVRLGDALGAVAFVEAGAVSEEKVLEWGEEIREAAGVGVRYFSPVGPIRADIAAPIDRQSGEDPVQFYLSIGQAF
ncbi:MAG: autotransporter assembly complex family protein [Pseudomonadota bacterium]